MSWHYREPTLEEILSDPIVTALMQADSVDPRELGVMLRGIADRLHEDERDENRLLARSSAVAGMERSAIRECRC